MFTVRQNRSLAGGELTPALHSRVDLARYQTSLRTMRNTFVPKWGGGMNRPGTQWVADVRDSTLNVRQIPWVFNDTTLSFNLIFNNGRIEFVRDAGLILETGTAITAITQANPAVVTAVGHGLSNGDHVWISGVVGMLQINGRRYEIANVAANTMELTDAEAVNINSVGFEAWISGGTVSRIYSIAHPYAEADLIDLDFSQSFAEMVIVHRSHFPRTLIRTNDTSWAIALIQFRSTIARPLSISVTGTGGTGLNVGYLVTAISDDTGEESSAGTSTGSTINAITNANPAVVTTNIAHGFVNGQEVIVSGVVGMHELNERTFVARNVAATTLELEGEDSSSYGAWSSGGIVAQRGRRVANVAAPSAGTPYGVNWTAVPAATFTIYRRDADDQEYGQIGESRQNSFSDTGFTPDLDKQPPIERVPFYAAGRFPSTVTHYKQRRIFAGSTDFPETVYCSQVRDYGNFYTNFPGLDTDTVIFRVVGKQLNSIRHILDIRRLLLFADRTEWQVAGKTSGELTPSDVSASPESYNGSSRLGPLPINNTALYVQARLRAVFDFSFDFGSDGYLGQEISIWAEHLFRTTTLTAWAYSQQPYSIAWMVRSDGVLLGLTYIRPQELVAWHRHDTDGLFRDVVSIPETTRDAVYFIVERTINSVTKRYIERLSRREIVDVIDNSFMDGYLSFDGRNTDTTHTMTVSGGVTWDENETQTITSSTGFFVAIDPGNRIDITDADGVVVRFVIETYTSDTIVTARPSGAVPTAMQGVARSTWVRAVDQIDGLWHLEGEIVSVLADRYVVANPNNSDYATTYTVTNGRITLAEPHGVIHVGLPYLSDVETLDIDQAEDGSIIGDKKLVSVVHLMVEETQAVWAGRQAPLSDTTDPREGLREVKRRQFEGYNAPVDLLTGKLEIPIPAAWNSHGRVFIRTLDPVPSDILSILPQGLF